MGEDFDSQGRGGLNLLEEQLKLNNELKCNALFTPTFVCNKTLIYVPMVSHVKDFDRIFQKHWAELYSFAFNVVRDKALAEDIVQEVFIDFWNRQVEVELPRAYLFQATRNQCAKALYNRRFDSVQVEKLASILPDLDEVQYEEIKNMLLEEIEKTATAILPDRCLLIFKMRFYEQRTYKDIAQTLDITESTVENQINKALKMLKESTSYLADIPEAVLLLLWVSII